MKMQKQDKVLAETFNRNFLRLLASIMDFDRPPTDLARNSSFGTFDFAREGQRGVHGCLSGPRRSARAPWVARAKNSIRFDLGQRVFDGAGYIGRGRDRQGSSTVPKRLLVASLMPRRKEAAFTGTSTS